MNKDCLQIKNAILDGYKDLEDLEMEINYMRGDMICSPKYSINGFHNDLRSRTDGKVYTDLIRKLDIEYIDETWQKADWMAVFIAGTIGIALDILITQTSVLKPLDVKIAHFMHSDKVQSLKDLLDKFSDSFRDGNNAPIDFQDFEMLGLKSIHAQYSFGHDPLRFVEGIIQMMTGNYRGVDKFGSIITAQYGQGIPDVLQAAISYIAHMVSDFCNANSLPFPGSTLLMQFGSQKVRDSLAAAFRSKLYNSRTFVYQNLPSLFVSMVIHGWAVFDCYTQTGKINFLIGDNLKYQPMLLVSNAMVMTSNLGISGSRALLGEPHSLFRINWPAILNTIRHSIKYLKNENKRISHNSELIGQLLEETEKNLLPQRTVDEYLISLNNEHRIFSESCYNV